MRPVRLTGVTGTSQWVPLDTYSPAPATILLTAAGATAIEYTLDDPFLASPAPVGIAVTLAADDTAILPNGARAVRMTGADPADVLHVSQQGIA